MTATSVIQFAGTVAAIATALVALAAVGLAVAVGTAADWDDWVGQTDGIRCPDCPPSGMRPSPRLSPRPVGSSRSSSGPHRRKGGCPARGQPTRCPQRIWTPNWRRRMRRSTREPMMSALTATGNGSVTITW